MLLKIEKGRRGKERKELQEIARQFLPVRISVFSFFHNKKLFFRNLFTWNIRNEIFSDLLILCSTIYPSFARPKRIFFLEIGRGVGMSAGWKFLSIFHESKLPSNSIPRARGGRKTGKVFFFFLKLLFTHFRRLINFFSVWGGTPKNKYQQENLSFRVYRMRLWSGRSITSSKLDRVWMSNGCSNWVVLPHGNRCGDFMVVIVSNFGILCVPVVLLIGGEFGTWFHDRLRLELQLDC